MRRRPVPKLRPFSPGILVFREKHGNRYFHVPTENHLYAACLSVLKDRFEDDWYYDPYREKRDSWDPEPPQMTTEEIENLPEGSIRVAARQQHSKYAEWARERDDGHKEYVRIKEAVENRDGMEAYAILRSRSDGEYEGFTIERLEDSEALLQPENPEHGTRWVDPLTGERLIFEAELGLGWIDGNYADIRNCVEEFKGLPITWDIEP